VTYKLTRIQYNDADRVMYSASLNLLTESSLAPPGSVLTPAPTLLINGK